MGTQQASTVVSFWGKHYFPRFLGKFRPVFLYVSSNLSSFPFLPNSSSPSNSSILFQLGNFPYVSGFSLYSGIFQHPPSPLLMNGFIFAALVILKILSQNKSQISSHCISVTCRFVLPKNIIVSKINFTYTSSVLLEALSLTVNGSRYMNIKSIIIKFTKQFHSGSQRPDCLHLIIAIILCSVYFLNHGFIIFLNEFPC